jgi:hypothetical protein
MGKIFYISESQYKQLVERKKNETLITKDIIKEIDSKILSLNEEKLLNEGIIDTIKSYLSKVLITDGIIDS